jgi:DDE superfamily endonuclease/Helix-turn-helix of DDE superfamily endonuclease
MYHTTGLDKDEILDLCEMIHCEARADERTWPPILGLYKSVVVTLTYLRRNRVQAEIAEAFEVSQSTISRAIDAMTGLIERVLRRYVPTADELDDRTQYLVDGTLLPCWSWADHRELYSGKHHTTGLNVQVAGTLDGELAWISDPIAGSRHDTYCLRESGALTSDSAPHWTGDKGYVGTGMATPIKKPAHRDLVDWEKEFNTQINKIRSVIEQIIANFKTWRIMHTDYRRPLATFSTTIAAVVGLHFYRAA